MSLELMSGEKLVYRTRLHWFPFIWRPLVGVGGVIAFVFAGLLLKWGVMYLLSFVLALLTLLLAGVYFWDYEKAVYIVTNRRVVKERGVLRRVTEEMMLSQLESVKVVKPVGAALLGYGFVDVRGTGGRRIEFDCVLKPEELRRRIYSQLGRGA